MAHQLNVDRRADWLNFLIAVEGWSRLVIKKGVDLFDGSSDEMLGTGKFLDLLECKSNGRVFGDALEEVIGLSVFFDLFARF